MKLKRRKQHAYTKPFPYKKTNLHFTCLDLFSDEFLTGIQLLDFHFYPVLSFFGRPFVKRFALCCQTLACPVCLSVLSVTLVYCGQTVGFIEMKIGKQIGLGPGHIVLDEDPAPLPQKGAAPPPQFSVTICCGQMAGWIKMKLVMQVGLGPDHNVLDGDPAPPPRKGGGAPNLWPISVVVNWLDGSRCDLVRW